MWVDSDALCECARVSVYVSVSMSVQVLVGLRECGLCVCCSNRCWFIFARVSAPVRLCLHAFQMCTLHNPDSAFMCGTCDTVNPAVQVDMSDDDLAADNQLVYSGGAAAVVPFLFLCSKILISLDTVISLR